MNQAIYASRAAQAVPGINRGWLMAIGIVIAVLGVIGLTMTYSLGVAIVFWSGILTLIAGAGQLLDAYHHKTWRGVAWHVVVGAAYIVIGIMLTTMPVTTAYWLTKIIAVSLILTGVMRLLIMFQLRSYRGLQMLLLISALVTIGLGLFVFQMVSSTEVLATADAQVTGIRSWRWVIGLFVAIELITEGVALIGISLAARPAHDG